MQKKIFILTLTLFTSSAFAQPKSTNTVDTCSELVTACEAAGYSANNEENGKGLQSDCIVPYLDGKMVKNLNSKTLNRKNSQSCRPQPQSATAKKTPNVMIENETKSGPTTTGPYVGPQTSGPGSMPIQTGPASSPNTMSK